MARQNFLLGQGERLTSPIFTRSGGGPKHAPYTFAEARDRLAPMIARASKLIDDLPSQACPKDNAVISLILNPEYIAKSYFPSGLLNDVGLEVVGSRPRKITPEKRSRNQDAIESTTTEMFAQGKRSAIRSWSTSLPEWQDDHRGAREIVSIETVSAPQPDEKVRGHTPDDGLVLFEVVLHAGKLVAQTIMLPAFAAYLRRCRIDAKFGRNFIVNGLTFVELKAPAHRVNDIARFTAVRTLRSMPCLRALTPPIRQKKTPIAPDRIPNGAPISNDVRVAIFDGGIPEDHPVALAGWVTSHEAPDLVPSSIDLRDHGVAVTSAALFGHIDPDAKLPRPYTPIDHHRVIGDPPGENPYELYETLGRIDAILANRTYDFVVLCIGPPLPIEDDDVHAWTSVLDDRLSKLPSLAMIAVGNNGEGDAMERLDRVQVPSDCVNALAVGACDSPGADWKRASYSATGPGRSPGRVKPDLVDFGGTSSRPFTVLGPDAIPTLISAQGTSFATPSAMRLAAGVRAHFGVQIDHLAIRALLIHTCEGADHDRQEVGWGRIARNLSDVVLCDDDTVRVVYQGEISPAKYLRAAIPVPGGVLRGHVLIRTTICYKSRTDPHHPSNYTRSGLEVTFRPHDQRFSHNGQQNADSAPFFGTVRSGAKENMLRRDAWKWENCLHSEITKRASSLRNPCFDIHYNARQESHGSSISEKLHYALIVTVQAKQVSDLYNQVVRQFGTHIHPIRPVLEIPVTIQ